MEELKYLLLDMGDSGIFLWDAAAWKDAILRPGGLSVWLNGFLVQFFHLEFLAPVLALALLAVSVLLTYSLCRKLPAGLFPLTLFPTAFLCLNVLTDSFSFQAVTDYILVCSIILALFRKPGRLISVIVRILLACALILATGPLLRPSCIPGSHRFIYAAWASLAVCFAVSCFWGKSGPGKMKAAFVVVLFSISCLAVILPFHHLLQNNRHSRQEQICRLSFYARGARWKEILSACRHMNMGNFILLNYANLAQSHEGTLIKKYWTSTSSRNDVRALCVAPDKTAGTMSLLSLIYYHVGDIAAAQDMAFEAGQYRESPSLLQMLVKTNIIFGNYRVAAKYISRLEKTLFYRNWASGMRQYLNDDAVWADPEFSSKRKGLPCSDAFIVRNRLMDDLMLLLEADPSNAAARDYALTWLEMSRDALALEAFVDKFYGSSVLPTLTPDMQAGLLVAKGGKR